MKKCLWLLPTLLLLVPLVIGAFLWRQLPAQVDFFLPKGGLHSLSKSFFVFKLPFWALVTHLFFVGLCALSPWLRHSMTDLPRTGFWWCIPTIFLLNCAWSYHIAFGGIMPFVLAVIILTIAIILWLIWIRRFS